MRQRHHYACSIKNISSWTSRKCFLVLIVASESWAISFMFTTSQQRVLWSKYNVRQKGDFVSLIDKLLWNYQYIEFNM